MLKKVFGTVGLALTVLIGMILFNTFSKKPWPIVPSNGQLTDFPDSAIPHLSKAIQLPTISISDSSSIDTSAFRAFNIFIDQSYPLIHARLYKTIVNQFSYIFEWKGQDTSLKPIILMGHYDVVPIEAATANLWSVKPFSGSITDSCVWGRGAADDKSGVISILEATEAMLKKGFIPKRSIFLCFGHDEEISGLGAMAIVQHLSARRIKAEMVLDEGGEITEDKIKDVKRPIAVIGVAEKGYASFELSVNKEGGHSSMPAKETAIDILSAGLYRLRKKSTAAIITPPVKEFLNRIGSSSDLFLNRMAAANMWLLEGTVKNILSAKPEGYAMIHTTIVPTILESGIKDNVIPAKATAIVNSRILPGETANSVENYIHETVNDDRIKIKKLGKFDSDPSPSTDIQSAAFKRIESAVYKIVPNVIPAPYLMIGATDSRYYRRISDAVVNFLPMTDSKGYHGINERLPLKDFLRGINFMKTVIEESNKEFK